MKEHRSKKDKNSKDNTDESDKSNDVEGGDGILFECELCNRSFYPSHVPLPKPLQAVMSSKGKSPDTPQQPECQSQQPQSLRDIKFLCPKCLRSRRPRLETILSLLVALNKLTVRLPEGEALQCLTERAMAWRDRAQKALDESDVAEALKKLSEQNKHDIATTAANNSKQNKKGKSTKKAENEEDSEGQSSTLDTSLTESDGGVDTEASNKSSEDAESKEKDVETKTYRPPEVKLSNKSLNTLESLMLEGDLLEVSMDETQHIWRVLQATEPRRSKRYPDLNRLEEQLENVREEKIKAKKKRRLELAEAQKAKNHDAEANEPKPKKAREDKSSPRKANEGSGKKTQGRRKRKNSESSEQEEEQEDCWPTPNVNVLLEKRY